MRGDALGGSEARGDAEQGDDARRPERPGRECEQDRGVDAARERDAEPAVAHGIPDAGHEGARLGRERFRVDGGRGAHDQIVMWRNGEE